MQDADAVLQTFTDKDLFKNYEAQVKETHKQLMEKEVLITMLGRQNSGKSTLLNACIGYE